MSVHGILANSRDEYSAYLKTASALALAIAIAVPANAQPSAPTRSSSGIEEIVVTAQKREQSVQDVPIAVTAISDESLQVNRVQSVNDLSGIVPGLFSRQNAGNLGSPSFSMRGVSATASSPSQDRQVSIYLDGVYLGGTRGSAFDFPDIQRIEALRGPQGTLFGRNATAGAINVVTRNPTGELGFRQEFAVGNLGQLRSRTTIDTPQVGPFSAYLTFLHDERKGDIRNLGAGTLFDRTNPFTDVAQSRSPKRLGNRNFENYFAALRFAPSETFSMIYKFDRADGVSTQEGRKSIAINPASPVGQLLLGVIAAQPAGGGKYGPVPLDGKDRRPDALNNAWTQEGYQKVYGHSLTTTLELSDQLTLKNISAYRHSVVYGPSSIIGLSGLEFTDGARIAYGRFVAISTLGAGFYAQTPDQQATTVNTFAGLFTSQVGSFFAAYEGQSYGKGHQYSTETQLNYTSDRFALTAGLLYYRAKEVNSGLPGFRPNFSFGPVPVLLPLGSIQDASSSVHSYAAYAQGEIHLTPQFDLVLGGRLTKDKKATNLITGGVLTGTRTDGVITGTSQFPGRFKTTKPTYSIGVNFTPNDDILVYAKYSTAFVSGGAVGVLTFAPETVKSLEAGIKADLLDRRLRVNLAVYRARYRHSQQAGSGATIGQPQLGVVVVDNGPLNASGIEVEVTAAPTDGLTLGGALGYTSGKLTDPNPLLGRPYRRANVPALVGSAYAQYQTAPLFGEAYLFFRIDGNYLGRFRGLSNPNIENVIPAFGPYEFQSGRWIANSRVALRSVEIGGATAEVGVFSRNLFNSRKGVFPFAFGDIQYNNSYQPARTYGADLIFSF